MGGLVMIEMFKSGGPIIWVILLSGIAALVAFIERGFHLHRARIKSDDFLKGILNILKGRNVDEALTICEETSGPVARIVKAAIIHRDAGRAGIEAAIAKSGLTEISRMESRVGIIATVAQAAPLLGLLGTVFGLMTMLDNLQETQWQAAKIADGLKAALAATAAGLIVAIPCYAAYNLVAAKIEALVVDMEKAASEITAFLADSK